MPKTEQALRLRSAVVSGGELPGADAVFGPEGPEKIGIVLKAAGGAPTLLVCHGGVIRVMKTYFEDMTNDEFTSYAMQNCGVLEYDL